MRKFILITFLVLISNAHAGEIGNDNLMGWQVILRNKDRIAKEVEDRVKKIVPYPDRFELRLIHRNFYVDIKINPERDIYAWDYLQWNFTIDYKTEPFDRDEIRDEVAAVLESALAVLTEEGLEPEKNGARIRCRTNYTENLRGRDVYYSFGKGHISYKDYEEPIQFRERWNHYTDGE